MDASLKASFNSMQLSPTATAGHSAMDAYSHSPAEECKDRRVSPPSGATAKEKKAKKASSGGSLGGGVRVACCARGMPKSHNNRNAYLLIPPDVRHGDALPCSFPSCRAIGSKFRYCSYCEKPVAKRNFRNRHAHGSLMSADGRKRVAASSARSGVTNLARADESVKSSPPIAHLWRHLLETQNINSTPPPPDREKATMDAERYAGITIAIRLPLSAPGGESQSNLERPQFKLEPRFLISETFLC